MTTKAQELIELAKENQLSLSETHKFCRLAILKGSELLAFWLLFGIFLQVWDGLFLSDAELELLDSVAEGKDADFISTWDNIRSLQGASQLYRLAILWEFDSVAVGLLLTIILHKWNNPSLRASLLIWLCTDKKASSFLTHRGISVIGAKIDGCLDLRYIDLDVPLIFKRCYFTEGIRLDQAKVKLLNLSGSYVASSGDAIVAQGAEIKGAVFLTDGFQAQGQVSLPRATIGGIFVCRKGIFENPKGNAIVAEGAEIKGSVFLDDGFQAQGQVSFAGATIGGTFQCRKGIFENPGKDKNGKDKHAILAQGAEIKGAVFLDDGFKAQGQVSFAGATIGRVFQCSKGIFENPKGNAILAESAEIKGAVFLNDSFKAQGEVSFAGATIGGIFACRKGIFENPQGYAIVAEGAEIKGSVFLNDGFKAQGQVSLSGATIGGNFQCRKGIFENPGKDKNGKDKHAILAQGAEIKGAVFLDDGFKAQGQVSFFGATIGVAFQCSKGIFENPEGYAIVAESAEIKGAVFLNDGFQAKGQVSFLGATIPRTFILSHVKDSQEMELDLRFAKIGTLVDQENSWAENNKLWLEGFVYDAIANISPLDSKSRLKWIRLQNLEENFSPQPYEQLAKVLRMSGHDEAATEVLIGKEKDRYKHGRLSWWDKSWNRFLGFTIDYGYSPHKALWGVLFFVLLGWGLFSWGNLQSLMILSKGVERFESSEERNKSSSTSKKVSTDYPKFNALMYSVDVFVPIINLHQQDYWLPNANKDYAEIPLSPKSKYKTLKVSLLRWYFWFHIIMGWVLSSLLVAGFTGLVRDD